MFRAKLIVLLSALALGGCPSESTSPSAGLDAAFSDSDSGEPGPDSGQAPQDSGTCLPKCPGGQCGGDGCGGTCNTCGDSETCLAGQCTPRCVPVCKDKVCGEDGCGGICGSCSSNASCEQGRCVARVDWCRFQWPLAQSSAPGAKFVAYLRLFEAGITNRTSATDPSPSLVVEAGSGPRGSDPAAWSPWLTAAPNTHWRDDLEPGNDEYQVELTAPALVGDYDLAFRATVDGAHFLYCDRAAGMGQDGSENGYQPANAAILEVSCAPVCQGRSCGPDGCGGLCGSCASDEFCNASGQCADSPCAVGYHPCGGQCVPNTSVDSCGSLCSTCPAAPNGTATCDGRACGIWCAEDYRLCNGDCAACPSDPNRASTTCSGSFCVIASCNPGFHLCNGQCRSNASADSCGVRCTPCPTDLHGTATCDGNACGISCAAGYHLCSGQCLSDASVGSCGEACSPCPTVANGTATCDGDSCAVACDSGRRLCNGVCAACPSDPNGAGTSCSGSACVIAVCKPGYLLCDGACAHCPAVGTPACAGNQCVADSCPSGAHLCSGACVANLSIAACGTSCLACPTDPHGTTTCSSDVCQLACAAGYRLCSGACAACPADPQALSAACVGDQCQSATCATGYHLCGGRCVSSASTASCGVSCSSCPVPANGSATCDGVRCGLSCAAGYHLCDGQCQSNASPSACRAVAIDSQSHTCVVTQAASVKCWGGNDRGQLGDDSTISRSTPVTVPGVSGATAIAVGTWHSCALVTGGAVKCWGWNSDGQLGDGTLIQRLEPVEVAGLTGAVAISAGQQHTCALLGSGELKCWGANGYGQLGDYSLRRTTPVTVAGLGTVAAVAAGAGRTCALVDTGEVYCWGRNYRGGLGNNSTIDSRIPVRVQPLGPVAGLTSGNYHSCTRGPQGTNYCWGYNGAGQLGTGDYTDALYPAGAPTGIESDISGGVNLTCSVSSSSSGTVRCWGSDDFGQCGDGTPTVRQPSPVFVLGLSGVSKVSAGAGLACALLSSGAVKCWGYNLEGGLGDGSLTSSAVPVDVKL